MNQVFTPLEAQLVEQYRKHLEVIVLLVTYNIDHLVDREVLESQLSRSNVLGHIHTGSVAS